MTTKQREIDRQHAVNMLRCRLEPGDTVVVVKRRHGTGYNRLVDFYTFNQGTSKRLLSHCLSGYIATLYGLRHAKDGSGVWIDDDGREFVASLAHILFGSSDSLDAELV